MAETEIMLQSECWESVGSHTSNRGHEAGGKPDLFVAMANFHGVNIPTMADFNWLAPFLALASQYKQLQHTIAWQGVGGALLQAGIMGNTC